MSIVRIFFLIELEAITKNKKPPEISNGLNKRQVRRKKMEEF